MKNKLVPWWVWLCLLPPFLVLGVFADNQIAQQQHPCYHMGPVGTEPACF